MSSKKERNPIGARDAKSGVDPLGLEREELLQLLEQGANPIEQNELEGYRAHARGVAPPKEPRPRAVARRVLEILGAPGDPERASTFRLALNAVFGNPSRPQEGLPDTVSAPSSGKAFTLAQLTARLRRSQGNFRGPDQATLAEAAPVLSEFLTLCDYGPDDGWPLPFEERGSGVERRRFMIEKIAPAVAKIGAGFRICEECADPFRAKDARHRFCIPGCSTRRRNRGKQRVGNRQSPAENARRRAEHKLKIHLRKCELCKTDRSCPTREGLLQVEDAMSHLSDGLVPEMAESMRARGGRKSKRATGETVARAGYTVRRRKT